MKLTIKTGVLKEVVLEVGETEVVIPDGVTSIGEHAFSECSALTSITIPDGVTSIGNSAFSYCSALTSITIPDGVTSIGEDAFSECSSLTSITIPASVTSIGNSAFSYCSSLVSITVPDGVTSIGEDAFSGCSSLMQILVSANNRSYCDIESVLYNKQKTELIKYPAGQKAISWIIPDGVTSIGEHAFNGCSSLTSITIPDGVTSIGEHAFFRCSSLTSITARINQETFSKLDAEHKVLVALGYLENIKSFDKEKFEHFSKYCKSQGKRIVLKIIEHDNIAAMYNFADFGGTSVKNYETIFAEAQKAKATQIVAFLLDYRNKNISTDALDKKEALELKRALTPPNPHSAAELKKLWSTKNLDDGTLEIRKYKGNDASASVPSQIGKKIVTSIGERAFYECSSLASITIPDSVTSIGNYAFSWCSSLASVTIPDGVTSIGWNAFNGCSSLTSITIPDGVTSIGGIAFSGCSSLASITVEANNLSYCDIDGVLFDVKKKKLLDYPQGRKDTSYTIPASVTSIEHGAFSGCSSLTSIAIPDSVTSIGDNAFSGCSSLASVTIPDGVTSIWASTFSKCSSLTSITIPDSVTSIGYTSIGYAAFSGCSSLTIHAPAGSYAEKYAAENNIKFAAI